MKLLTILTSSPMHCLATITNVTMDVLEKGTRGGNDADHVIERMNIDQPSAMRLPLLHHIAKPKSTE